MEGTTKTCFSTIETIRMKLDGAKAIALLLDTAHNSDHVPDSVHWAATLLMTNAIDEALELVSDLEEVGHEV